MMPDYKRVRFVTLALKITDEKLKNTVKLGYNELGYNELSVIANKKV
jgi:hypothetical protein